MNKKHKQFAAIFDEAYRAGMLAGNARVPQPMTVVQHSNMLDDNSPVSRVWVVPSGVCGFAWVHMRATGFGKWLFNEGFAVLDYPSGVILFCHEFGQSMEKKSAWASAFADVLQSHGIKAHSESRID